MSWVKNYYTEYFDNLELLESADSLMVLTRFEIKPLRECFWSYELNSVINDEDFTLIKEESGNEMICGCKECKKFGNDLFEYYSIYKALTLIEDKFLNIEYILYTNCERFYLEASNDIFWYYDEIYKCDFLKTVGRGISRLLPNVEISYRSSEEVEGLPF